MEIEVGYDFVYDQKYDEGEGARWEPQVLETSFVRWDGTSSLSELLRAQPRKHTIDESVLWRRLYRLEIRCFKCGGEFWKVTPTEEQIIYLESE